VVRDLDALETADLPAGLPASPVRAAVAAGVPEAEARLLVPGLHLEGIHAARVRLQVGRVLIDGHQNSGRPLELADPLGHPLDDFDVGR